MQDQLPSRINMGSMIQLKSGDDAVIDAYHVEAIGERIGGLVLIMEIFGVTPHIKHLCDKFAEWGYEVISPALYDRTQKNFQSNYSPESLKEAIHLRDTNKLEFTIFDSQAAIDRMKDKGPVYITGFCYGGSIAWLAACRCTDLTAAAAYYGRLIVDFKDEQPLCPVILHYGNNDESIPMEDVHLVESAQPDVPVYIYDAGHGFQSDRPSHYDHHAATLSWERTVAFFMENG